METIQEVIVAEGRDDEAAIRRAVNAQVITTHGFGIRPETLKLIEKAYNEQGIIIFTDPDFAGDSIRKRLTALYPNAKQAFLTQAEAEYRGDIGIENACPEDIIKALKKAKASSAETKEIFTKADMFRLGLTGYPDSAKRREAIGSILGIGTGNANTFLRKLNSFAITKEELIKAWESCNPDLE